MDRLGGRLRQREQGQDVQCARLGEAARQDRLAESLTTTVLSRIGCVLASWLSRLHFAPTNALPRLFIAARMAATRQFLTQG